MMYDKQQTGGWPVNRKRLVGILLGGVALIAVTAFFLFWWPSLATPDATPAQEAATNLSDVKGRGGLTEESGGQGESDKADPSSPATPSSGEPTPLASPAPSPSPSGTSQSQPTLSSVFTRQVIAANSPGAAQANCPSGSVVVGGGFRGQEESEYQASYRSGNSWVAKVKNIADEALPHFAYAQCVTNIPGSVTTSINTINIAANSAGTINKDCPSGQTVLSGGFEAEHMKITFSNRVDNGWRVNATNPTVGPRPLKVHVNCYSGGSVTVTQSLETVDVPAGWTWTKAKACASGLAIIGGFASSAQIFHSYYLDTNSKWSIDVYNNTGSPTPLKAYFYCATF